MFSVPRPSSLASVIRGCWIVTYASSVFTPSIASVYARSRTESSCGSTRLTAAMRRRRLAVCGARSTAAWYSSRAWSVAARASRTTGASSLPVSSGRAVRSRSSMTAWA
jgi:hypothetical protein